MVLLIIATQRVVMLGLNAAGKSTIISHLNMGSSVFVKPTIGFNVEEVEEGFIRGLGSRMSDLHAGNVATVPARHRWPDLRGRVCRHAKE